ncbi:MAG: N-acetylglucosamine kinase [Promicromonosporaceae bacterium]|nr:N-acetylglucosamine kinase [Promicromonosporaceae bacterium]
MSSEVLVVVDGGGTKTDVAVISPDGQVLARARHGRYYPQEIGAAATAAALDQMVTGLLAGLGSPPVALAAVYYSGLDFQFEIDALRAELAGFGWTARQLLVDNDLFPVLRAGTAAPVAVAVICGTGSNALGRGPDGAVVRFAAIGEVSGDWGGGDHLGLQAVWHSARAEDGRGPQTALRAAVLNALGFGSMAELIEAYHRGAVNWSAFSSLPPVILQVAGEGDEVARSLVFRQADEIVAFATAAIERLGATEEPVPVVLAGGVVAARDPLLTAAIGQRLATAAPNATMEIVTAPPLLGSALLALDAVSAPAEALARARAELT